MQRDTQATTQSSSRSTSHEEWLEVNRLLKERARRRIWLPDWEQIIVEQMYRRSDKALRHIPALMQTWRTMCLIRSFQRPATEKQSSLVASFEDLAEAIMLGRKAFRQGSWFPSAKQVFDQLPARYVRTGATNPVTGKSVVYEKRPEPARWQSVLPLTEVTTHTNRIRTATAPVAQS